MLKGDETLSFLLSKIEDELHAAGLVDYSSMLLNTPLTRKEFLYKSWLTAEREVETSVWTGAVIEGSLVIQADIEYEGLGVKITCDDLTLNVEEQSLEGKPSVMSIDLSGAERDQVRLDLVLNESPNQLFAELCMSVVELLMKLDNAKQIQCKDDLTQVLADLMEIADEDSAAFEIPKRSQPTPA